MADRVKETLEEMKVETARALWEALAVVRGCTTGMCTLEGRFKDGELIKEYQHHGPVGATELEKPAV